MVEINGFDTDRILVDGESSTDILLLNAFKSMGQRKKELKNVDFLIIGVAGCVVYLLRAINLPVALDDGWKIIKLTSFS